ncbi:MAG: alpha/beta hydrolase [Pseudomonadota bacterium]|nr:alpha/beta hydrolase [Pseudomonadota bacterium]
MPGLVRAGRRLYAIDPRDFGDSEQPLAGYDPDTSAKDLHAFVEALELGVDVVGHDVATWIAFAHAIAFSNDVRRLVLTEASITAFRLRPEGFRIARQTSRRGISASTASTTCPKSSCSMSARS